MLTGPRQEGGAVRVHFTDEQTGPGRGSDLRTLGITRPGLASELGPAKGVAASRGRRGPVERGEPGNRRRAAAVRGARRGAGPPGLGLQAPSQSPPPAGTLPSLGRRSHHSWPEWGPRRGLAWLLSAFRGPGPAGDTSGRGAGYRGASAVVAALREGVRQWERVLKSSVRPSSCHSQTRLGHTLLLWAPTLPGPSYPGGGAWAGAGSGLGTEVQLVPRVPAPVYPRGSVTYCHKRRAPKTTRIRPLRDLEPEVPTQAAQGGAPSGVGVGATSWPPQPRRSRRNSASGHIVQALPPGFMRPLSVFSSYEDTCGM